jgi:cytochrome o ubiquinol oxidase operon protein cyoD
MKLHQHITRSTSHLSSYIVGFVLSIALTIIAYIFVVYHLLPSVGLMVVLAVTASVQVIVQLIFFLHLGRGEGSRWKIVTFALALLVVAILVVGSIWIMNNLNYNMMKMTPQEQNQYLRNNEGI